MDHVVLEKTQCEKHSSVLFSMSTPICEEKLHALRMTLWLPVHFRIMAVQSSHQNKEQAQHYTLP